MAHKVIIIGGTSGLGLLTARNLSARGAEVVVTGRDLSGITQQDRDQGLEGVGLDLGSLAAARAFAEAVGTDGIDVLILNAGQQHVTERAWSADGFEATMAVNFLAPLVLLDALVPRLRPQARVLWTSSGTHNPDEVRFAHPLEDASLDELVHPTASFARGDGFRWYATSKLCVTRIVPELARTLAPREVRVNAFDPGLMPGTGLARNYPAMHRVAWAVLSPAILIAPGARRPATSARNLADLAVDPRFDRMTGAYLVDRHPARRSIASFDAAAAATLLADARELLGLHHL